jgi:hypothetical protein
MEKEPTTELHQPFSSDGATATPWLEARGRLEKAEVYDGRGERARLAGASRAVSSASGGRYKEGNHV